MMLNNYFFSYTVMQKTLPQDAMKPLTTLNAWIALENHAQSIRLQAFRDLKKTTPHRDETFRATVGPLHLDFSHQQITPTTLSLLRTLAEARHLQAHIHKLFSGHKVNQSENRPALHTALRTFDTTPLLVDGKDIVPGILATREKIQHISDKIRTNAWLGCTGKPISHIVHIGIGGSDLGPRFCLNALHALTNPALHYHFISDADPCAFEKTTRALHPETTLFIIASKSFTTPETLYNTHKAIAWLEKDTQQHTIAVTGNAEKAHAFGIQHVLPLEPWVGGRYSWCSAINLITAIAVGFEHFTALLNGAYFIDQHFATAPFERNLPVLLGLLGIWNNNFLHLHQLLLLVYTQQLDYFVPYLQQVDMESNGKSIDNQGTRITDYATGPILWGGLGNQAQHSYYQLLCQGTHQLAGDLITLDLFDDALINQLCFSKKNVLANGNQAPAHHHIPGNMPLNHLRITDGSPNTIGALIALYEHKIFTQSVIWNINPFDQPGVDAAKQMHPSTIKEAVTP